MSFMTIDAQYVYEGLLRYNYFPMVKERRDDIVPVFTTEDFSTDVSDKLIAALQSTGQKGGIPRTKDGYDQIEYRTTRFNNVLRLMHIPHPYPFARLCKCIHDHWKCLAHVCTNRHSQIKPAHHGGGRVVAMGEYDAPVELGRVVVMDREHFPEDVLRHMDMSSGAEYMVEADVSSCFPSLYSHAIPWALVGHDVAKQNRRNSSAWFNKIDACQRYLKRNETQGVPVGPATSNVINEVVLFRVDTALADKGYRFHRAIDDYTCYCSTRDQAESFIRDLERELSAYLLSLNAKKVSISPLPLPHKSSWVTELSLHLPVEKEPSPKQVATFLDYAMSLQHSHPEGSVLKYAARALVNRLNTASIDIYFRYTLQFIYHCPVLLPIVCQAMMKFIVPVCGDRLRAVLDRHIEFRRSDAVCWSIHLLFLAEEKVGPDLAKKIVASGDCMGMAMLVATGEDSSMVTDFVRQLDGKHPYELDKYWLLIYELTRSGHLKRSDLEGYFDQSGFKVLADEGVEFIKPVSIEGLDRERVGFSDNPF